MKKATKLILMLCLIFSGALSYAHSETKTEREKEASTPVEIIEAANLSGLARGNAIIPVLNGHILSVTFSENMGQVSVEVSTAAGASVQCLSVLTPNGLQVYIPNAGDYVVTFTLSNGDVYYGEFTVTD